MTSRVEELQRMCDSINENGGLDSGEWHTALLAQIAQNLAVIADVMMAERKDEPSNSEKPNNSKVSEIPTGSEPQTERIKTLDYCDICNHKGCDNCIANSLDDYCVPSGYEPITQTETQNSNLTFEKRTMLDCYNCKRFDTEDECIECHYEPKDEPQTDVYEYHNGEWVKPDCPWK